MVLSAILIGGLYPAIVQKFQVQPNEQAKEAPYIEKNIEATREAYGIDGRRGDATTRARAAPADRTDAARRTPTPRPASGVLDPNVVSPTFQQLQQISAATTSSRPRWTSTATAPAARSRTPSSACAS